MVVIAPGADESACGMRVSLGENKGLKVYRRREYEGRILNGGVVANGNGVSKEGGGEVYVYEVENASPTDCVACGLDDHGIIGRLGLKVRMVVSGVNVGANLGSDILYSGTFSAARQAGIYGVPAVAGSFVGGVDEGREVGIDGVLGVVERLFGRAGRNGKEGVVGDAWKEGRVLVNVNVPKGWKGEYANARLGKVWYREVVRMTGWDKHWNGDTGGQEDGLAVALAGGKMDFHGEEGSDFLAIQTGYASVSTLQTWPCSHPLALPDNHLLEVLESSAENGLPHWIETLSITKAKVQAVQQQSQRDVSI